MRMVLAGNREQFERYLSENGLTDSQARYVFEEKSMLGCGHDYEIVEYGTYYEHPKYYELKKLLEAHKIN
jgi:hypothetical protein